MTDISFLGETPVERLKALMKTLRDPDCGCPWDVKQTFETIAPYTIEEAYEVNDAINKQDLSALREELGDLLFQVIFHSRMAEETGIFNFDNVCDELARKMVRRHPHVFESPDKRNADEQTVAWEEMKAKERKSKPNDKPFSRLDGVALALPALMRAEKLQKRAAGIGFDWPDIAGVIDKIKEESEEVVEAANLHDQDAMEDEIGDLLFAVANLARYLKVDPEVALRRTNSKFTKRFHYMEAEAIRQNLNIEDMNLEQMEALWQDAKIAST